jgi:Tfp pilus assembly protein PilF
MIGRIISLLLMFLICSCATNEKNVKQTTAHYQLGLSYLNEGKDQLAYTEFQKALEVDPDNKDVHYALGIVYLRFEDFEKARDSFQRVVDIDREYPGAYYNLGVAYAKMGKWSDAVDSFKEALNNPVYTKHEMAYTSLGEAYYRLGRIDDAINAYNNAIKRVNDFLRPYYGLALCYNAKGNYGEAATAMKTALGLDPFFRGDRDKAIKYFEDRRLLARGEEAQDIKDYLEILMY